MAPHFVHADGVEILNGCRQSYRPTKVRRAGLEFVREHVPGRVLVADELDHVASCLVRRHLLEEFPFAYQPANPCGAQHLVAAEGVEVDSEVVELDSHVRRALRAIYYCRYAARDLPHIAQCRDRTRGVRYMRDREHLGASRDQRAQMIEVEATVRRDLGDLKGGLSAQRELLPRNKVGVMLQSRDDDFIAAMYIGRRGDQIQGFRRAASEDQAI